MQKFLTDPNVVELIYVATSAAVVSFTVWALISFMQRVKRRL